MRIGHQGQNYRFKHEHLQRQLVIETSRTTTDELQLTANARGHFFTGTKIANIREHLARMSSDILPRADSLSSRYSSEIPSGSKPLSSQILQIMEFDLADPTLTVQDRDTNSEAIIDGREAPYRYEDTDGELFIDGVAYTDIDQNQIADCYLMTALASLAETNPRALQNMITDHGNDIYTVHFGGDFGDVRVDDDLVVNQFGTTRYAGTGTGTEPELWAAIIEKAYAQASGGYENIEYGQAHEAIAQLTGHNDFTVQAGRRFNPKQLATALTEGRSVTASSFASDSKKYDTSPDGVAGSHAYTVLDVGQAENGDWQVTLYNPWGGSGTSSQGAHRGEFTISWEAFTAASNFRSVAVMNTSIPEAT